MSRYDSMPNFRPKFTSDTSVEINNPDDPNEMPIFHGPMRMAKEMLINGLYNGKAWPDVWDLDVNVAITDDGIWMAPADDMKFARRHGFPDVEPAGRAVRSLAQTVTDQWYADHPDSATSELDADADYGG